MYMEEETLHIYSMSLSYRDASALQVKERDLIIKVQNHSCWLDQIFHNSFLAPAWMIG